MTIIFYAIAANGTRRDTCTQRMVNGGAKQSNPHPESLVTVNTSHVFTCINRANGRSPKNIIAFFLSCEI